MVQKTKIMASDPITSWQIDGGKVGTVSDFIFSSSKMNVVGDYSHEIQRHMLLGRKAIIKLDSALKSRNITLLTKVCSVQFSLSVMPDSLQSHELQHARPPSPLSTPRSYPNSCPLSRWYHSTISSSVVPFSSQLQSFPVSGSFQMSQFFTSGGQSIGVSASTSVLLMNTQD